MVDDTKRIDELARKLQTGEIKPEFGNKEHIDAIRYLETEGNEGNEGKLKNYEVDLWFSSNVSVQVKATNEEEALLIAKEHVHYGDFDDMELEDYSVSEIQKKEEDGLETIT